MRISRRQEQRNIAQICRHLADYQRDLDVAVTESAVSQWVLQFKQAERQPVLSELAHLLGTRYVSRTRARDFLRATVKGLAVRYYHGDLRKCFAQTCFLDVQHPGKSQSALLDILREIAAESSARINTEADASIRRFVHVDDVLCTGATLYRTMRSWWLTDCGVSERQDLLPLNAEVHFVFIALHLADWWKTLRRFEYDKALRPHTTPRSAFALIPIQNDRRHETGLQMVYPRTVAATPEALEFLRKQGPQDEYAFRRDDRPINESLFSSRQRRDEFEAAMLRAGLMIMEGLETSENVFPLGLTNPSEKGFGYGAVFFSWRNVPNTVPLALWMEASNWRPLLPRRRRASADV